jgi:hypothetical protein
MIMGTLGPEARALLEAGKRATRPTAADRARITQALNGRGYSTSHKFDDHAAGSLIGKGFGLPSLGVVAAGLALVGGLLLFWPREAGLPPAAVVDVQAALPAVQALLSAPTDVEYEAPTRGDTVSVVAQLAAAPTAAPEKRAAPEARRTTDKLAEEVAILSRAEKELHGGRFSSALTALDEHRRKFPRGTLSQERVALRVHVLCGLGRVTDAEAELGVLKRLSPGSMHEGRARAACGTAAK